jgi:hypothetical protein
MVKLLLGLSVVLNGVGIWVSYRARCRAARAEVSRSQGDHYVGMLEELLWAAQGTPVPAVRQAVASFTAVLLD